MVYEFYKNKMTEFEIINPNTNYSGATAERIF